MGFFSLVFFFFSFSFFLASSLSLPNAYHYLKFNRMHSYLDLTPMMIPMISVDVFPPYTPLFSTALLFSLLVFLPLADNDHPWEIVCPA